MSHLVKKRRKVKKRGKKGQGMVVSFYPKRKTDEWLMPESYITPPIKYTIDCKKERKEKRKPRWIGNKICYGK